MNIPIIQCPLDCLAGIAEVFNGQYDHPLIDQILKEDAIYTPRIFDIGANIGAFSIWAKERWKRSILTAWEPNPNIFAFLEKNVSFLEIVCYPFAICLPGYNCLFTGHRNRLCCSMTKTLAQDDQHLSVLTVRPYEIGPCDILKIDCEGGEADILENITFIPAYLAVEWHSDELRVRCEKAMLGKMALVESSVTGPGYGMMKFIRLRS